MSLQNDLLLRAANGEKTERTPVWVMRQAGRILPEYREVRNSVKDFKALVTTPDLAAEVTIQPVDILGVDAAIIFSDILEIPEAMGLPYEMLEKKGPLFPQTITCEADLKKIHIADVADLAYVTDAIKIVKQRLNNRVPIIGFAGAPWTIFAYMVEGQGSKTFSVARKMLYQNPSLSHKLLEMITLSTIDYLKAQIAAGANIVQIFDSWGGVPTPAQFKEFSLPYLKQISEAITEVPVTVFAKGAFFAMEEMGNLPCRTLGLDWNMDVKDIRAQIGTDKTLQGNLDPCLLYAEDEIIVAETEKMLQAFGPTKHIANLGHGVYPDTEARKVKLFIDTVKNYRHNA